MFIATTPDLLRLVAVPVLAWAAWRDVRTRRVPNAAWYPLVAVGLVALAWDAATLAPWEGQFFWLRVALSLGIVVPLAYGFWRLGGFGGADAKAFMALALLFPTYPTYYPPPSLVRAVGLDGLVLPPVETTVGVFSLTVLTNTVVLGALYPLALAARNLAAGRVAPVALVGWPVPVERVTRTYGRLLETPAGYTRGGLDLDALRMYLRWRGVTLADLRDDASLRDPSTLPAAPNDPTDGRIRADEALRPDGGEAVAPPGDEAADEGATDAEEAVAADAPADPWGAEAFLDDVGSAYGTSPAQLRAGLDLLVARETVWVSPGLPFIVPLFLGLCAALAYGDLLFGLLGALGLVPT